MRPALLFPLLMVLPLLLAGCEKEPKFEDRYEKAAQEIETRAKTMDADIAEADKAAQIAGDAAPKALPPPAPPSNPPKSSGE